MVCVYASHTKQVLTNYCLNFNGTFSTIENCLPAEFCDSWAIDFCVEKIQISSLLGSDCESGKKRNLKYVCFLLSCR